MSAAELDRATPEVIAGWPRPAIYAMPEHQRRQYIARHRALAAFESGESVSSAAERYGVSRNTLTRIIDLATALDPSGIAWGFRACTPYFRDTTNTSPKLASAVPVAAVPHAFSKVLRAHPTVSAVVAAFDGRLPSGRRRSPAFDRMFRDVKKALKGTEHLYPLNTADKGRRALLEHLRRVRKRVGNALVGEASPPEPAIERLDQLFMWMPFMRAEFDGHREDVNWKIEVPTPDGGWATRAIRCVYLLIEIEAVLRVITGWGLVFAGGYRQWDLMEMFANSMRTWAPQVLTTPDLCYVSGAGMPNIAMPDGKAPRAVLTAGDNYRAHQAKHVLHSLLHVHLGVWNWSQSHIPEKRGIIEAFFHHIESGALRGIAGGFIPAARRGDKPISSNSLDPNRHPLNVLAMRELMDVIVTAFNADGLRGLHDRSPLGALRDYIGRGGWVWQSSLSEVHADEISLIHLKVTIRGSRADSRQPYVEWKGARYRSDALLNRFDLCGKTFSATIPSNDLRVMTLFDDRGHTFVRLPALPPWDASKHDVRLREQVIKWDHAKVLSIAGVDDAIRAYHHYVRKNAHSDPKIAELFARDQVLHLEQVAKPPLPKHNRLPKVPREGWIGAEDMEDLP